MNEYPIKYALLLVTDNNKKLGYIVSKVFIITDEKGKLKYIVRKNQSIVVFPYKNVNDILNGIEMYRPVNYYSGNHEIVNKIYNTYGSAKLDCEKLNKNISSYNKMLLEELEMRVQSLTCELVISKNDIENIYQEKPTKTKSLIRRMKK